MKQLIMFSLLVITISSCSEKYSLDEHIDKNRIVIEGVVNNDSIPLNKWGVNYYDAMPTYVRVTRVSPTIETNYSNPGDGIIPVNNAIVIVSDDIGNIDTLSGRNTTNKEGSNGYYYSTNLLGSQGRTYYLKVLIDNKEYTSEAYMPPPLLIDSMSVPDSFFDQEKGNNYVSGGIKIYFDDLPNVKNYYMFKIHSGDLMLTLVDDKFLSPNIHSEGFMLDDGENSRYWMNNYFMLESKLNLGYEVTVSANSITKFSYDFYTSLLKQFTNDGGILSPTPASAKGNISNDALGLFRASSRTYISGKR